MASNIKKGLIKAVVSTVILASIGGLWGYFNSIKEKPKKVDINDDVKKEESSSMPRDHKYSRLDEAEAEKKPIYKNFNSDYWIWIKGKKLGFNEQKSRHESCEKFLGDYKDIRVEFESCENLKDYTKKGDPIIESSLEVDIHIGKNYKNYKDNNGDKILDKTTIMNSNTNYHASYNADDKKDRFFLRKLQKDFNIYRNAYKKIERIKRNREIKKFNKSTNF